MANPKRRFEKLLRDLQLVEEKADRGLFSKDLIRELCFRARHAFLNEQAMLELEPPIVVVGDIHGQFRDLQMIFQQQGSPDKGTVYLFLGDYVDRGNHSVECITYLTLYKLLYPKQIYLLRGNHESRVTNQSYGFLQAVNMIFGPGGHEVWEWFNTVFNCLPVAARISKKIFCMHGGISQDQFSWEQYNLIHRPCSIPDFGLLCDLLWADPHPEVRGFKHSPRGVSFLFGEDTVRTFCEKFEIDLIVRAHQVVADGYEFFANRRLLTVFSAANYCGAFDNSGAVLIINENLICKFGVRRPIDHIKKNAGGETKCAVSEVNKMQDETSKFYKDSMQLVYSIGKKVRQEHQDTVMPEFATPSPADDSKNKRKSQKKNKKQKDKDKEDEERDDDKKKDKDQDPDGSGKKRKDEERAKRKKNKDKDRAGGSDDEEEEQTKKRGNSVYKTLGPPPEGGEPKKKDSSIYKSIGPDTDVYKSLGPPPASEVYKTLGPGAESDKLKRKRAKERERVNERDKEMETNGAQSDAATNENRRTPDGGGEEAATDMDADKKKNKKQKKPKEKERDDDESQDKKGKKDKGDKENQGSREEEEVQPENNNKKERSRMDFAREGKRKKATSGLNREARPKKKEKEETTMMSVLDMPKKEEGLNRESRPKKKEESVQQEPPKKDDSDEKDKKEEEKE